MKKVNLFALLFLCLFSLTLVSCDKDDDEEEPSRAGMLTGEEWTANNIVFDDEFDLAEMIEEFPEFEDIFAEMFDLSTWKFKFNDNGTAVITIDGDAGTSTWEFANNQQSIVFAKGTPDEFTAKITKLTASELYLEVNLDDFPMDPEAEEDPEMLEFEKMEIQFER